MSRISVLTRDELPAALRPLWDKMKTYGAFENQAGVMAHRAPIFRNMWTLLTELSDEAVLPKRYLELCLVTVSLLNRCDYCVSHHAPKLAIQGVDPMEMDTATFDRFVRDEVVSTGRLAKALDLKPQ